MVMKKIILVVLAIFVSNSAFALDKAYFDDIKKSVDLQKDEDLVVMYQDIGACVKCYLRPLDIIKKLESEGVIKKYKLVALVKCDRDVELNIYKNMHEWKHYMYRDDGKGYKRLDAKRDTYISVFSYNGKKLKDMK